jgi:hypothetical protein
MALPGITPHQVSKLTEDNKQEVGLNAGLDIQGLLDSYYQMMQYWDIKFHVSETQGF